MVSDPIKTALLLMVQLMSRPFISAVAVRVRVEVYSVPLLRALQALIRSLQIVTTEESGGGRGKLIKLII